MGLMYPLVKGLFRDSQPNPRCLYKKVYIFTPAFKRTSRCCHMWTNSRFFHLIFSFYGSSFVTLIFSVLSSLFCYLAHILFILSAFMWIVTLILVIFSLVARSDLFLLLFIILFVFVFVFLFLFFYGSSLLSSSSHLLSCDSFLPSSCNYHNLISSSSSHLFSCDSWLSSSSSHLLSCDFMTLVFFISSSFLWFVTLLFVLVICLFHLLHLIFFLVIRHSHLLHPIFSCDSWYDSHLLHFNL